MCLRLRSWKTIVISAPVLTNFSLSKPSSCIETEDDLQHIPKSDFIIRSESYDGSKFKPVRNLSDLFNRQPGPSSWLIQYDVKTRNPRFAYEYLRREDFQGSNNAKRKKNSFFPEPSLQIEDFKIRPKEYNNWGFDRGHMIPAADFPRSKESLQSTFTMANICPQVPSLNKGVWAKLESWLRYLVMSEFDEMVIISGPLYAPVFINGHWLYAHRTIGTFPKLITVPSHFFKVVVAIKKETISGGDKGDTRRDVCCFGAFVVPNTDEDYSNTPIQDLLVRIDQLQAISGLLFFDDQTLNDVIKTKADPFVPKKRDLRLSLSVGPQLKELPAGTLSIDKNTRWTAGNQVLLDASGPTDYEEKDGGFFPQQRYGVVKRTGTAALDRRQVGSVKHLCSVVECRNPFFTK